MLREWLPTSEAIARMAVAPTSTAEHDERERREAFERRMRRLDGLPILEADARRIAGSQLDETPALRDVRRWRRDERTMLVLIGGVGTGKTLAALEPLAEHGGLYLPATQLRAAVTREAWGHHDAPDVLRHGFVVLDDLGAEIDDSAKFNAALFDFVNSRLSRGRRTIITSNLTRDRIRERYDRRILDRLNHAAAVVAVSGASLRAKGPF